MANEVWFISQARAERMSGMSDSVCISITEPGRWAKLDSSWMAVHRVQFHDADGDYPGYTLFDEGMARDIIDFVQLHGEAAKTIVVHCHAGVSRSAAVARFIAEWLQLPYPADYALYNKRVYQKLFAAHTAGCGSRESAFGEIED